MIPSTVASRREKAPVKGAPVREPDIWVQPTGGGEPVRVTPSAADDREPAFSPDGSRIAFRSERDGGGIYLVPALGGPERLLVRDGRGPRFSPDGRWLSYWVGGRGAGSTKLFVMPADGGVSQPVHPDRVPFGDALWSPDGRHLMFAGSGPGQSGASPELWITRISERGESAGTPFSSGAADRLHGRITGPDGLVAWMGDRVYFRGRHGDGGSLWTLPVNREGRAAGNAELVLYGTTHIGGVAVDESGRVFFASQNARANIWTIEVDARGGVRGEPLALMRATASDHWPSLSADGRSLAFLSRRGGRDGLWVTDVATGASWSVAAGATRSAAISPDGRRIAYQTVGAPSSMFLVETAGGVPRQICEPCVGAIWGWTSDSRHVIANAPGEPRLVAIDAADGTVSRLAESASGRLWHPRPSPDGRWLAFIDWLDADRTRQVIAPFSPGSPPDESAWIHLTDGESVDEENAWSADGRTLYFVSERDGFRCVYALPLDPETGRALGEPVGLLHMHGARRSIVDTAARPARIDVGGGRLVFAVREVDGNIWSLTPH
jgi:eukaryotic-like serine/threonine-protein kinase